VLQVDRGDPLAAGLDDVLGAVNQGQVAVGGDLADVAGAQPAVVELVGVDLGAVGGVVGAGDPRAADLQLAEGLAVVGDDLALVVDQAGLDGGGEAALGVAVLPLLLAGDACRRVGDGAERG